jgi:hypothetical protein
MRGRLRHYGCRAACRTLDALAGGFVPDLEPFPAFIAGELDGHDPISPKKRARQTPWKIRNGIPIASPAIFNLYSDGARLRQWLRVGSQPADGRRWRWFLLG